MAANITITRVASAGGPEYIRSPRSMEIVKLQGATTAVDDTGTYTVQSFKVDANTFVLGGGFDITGVSGNVITVRSKIALGNATSYVTVCQGI